MIRIVNSAIHTKIIDLAPVRSVFLWRTSQVCTDRYTAFLQFGYWKQTPTGASLDYNIIWKYPRASLAENDLKALTSARPDSIKPFIIDYIIHPKIQFIGEAPPSASAAFTALNGLLPKNPL